MGDPVEVVAQAMRDADIADGARKGPKVDARERRHAIAALAALTANDWRLVRTSLNGPYALVNIVEEWTPEEAPGV